MMEILKTVKRLNLSDCLIKSSEHLIKELKRKTG